MHANSSIGHRHGHPKLLQRARLNTHKNEREKKEMLHAKTDNLFLFNPSKWNGNKVGTGLCTCC